MKGEINVLKEQINSERNSNRSRTERLEYINNNISNNLDEIKKDVSELFGIKKQIEFINSNNDNLEEEDSQINNDLRTIENICATAKELYFKIKNTNLEVVETKESLFSDEINDQSINLRRKELDALNANIKDIVNNINDLNNTINDIKSKLDVTNDKLIDAQNKFHSDETKLDTLKNMLERYEGFGNTVKSILDNADKFNGIKGVVTDLIKTKKEYETAIEVALGNTLQNIVVKNVESSKEIINFVKTNKLGRVTTLPLSALKLNDNTIYETAKSEAGVIDIAVNLVSYDSEYKLLADYLLRRCLIVDTFDNAKEIFNKYNSGIKIITIGGELFNPGGAVSGGAYKNSTSLIGRKREYEELKEIVSNTKNELDNLTQQKNSLSEDYDKKYNELERLKEKLNSLNIDKNTKTLNIINDMKLKYSNVSNKTQFLSDNIVRIVGTINGLLDDKTKIENDDLSSNDSIKIKEQKIIDYENQIVNIDEDVKKSQSLIAEKTEIKNSNLANRKEYYDSKDRITNEQINLENESNRLATLLEKANVRIEEITNSMYESYNMTYATAREKYKEDLGTSEEIKQLAKEKRKVIQELGPINVNAIEEYQQIGERYDLMTTQYEDIKKSEEMIAEIVDELDANMRSQFDENFKKIKEQFEIVFKKLFGGGKANLELVETDDTGVLDAGVAIIVQPPGKKLGNMMQLSGGEKALTAIALLFAIQNLKPSPFCLLDEIEAALDESNVDRYAEYLKNLTNETQFILITHRRGTMEKADRLYGITMQEKGITSLVSVDLIEDQLDK